MDQGTAFLVLRHARNVPQQPPHVQGVRPTTRYHQTFVVVQQDFL